MKVNRKKECGCRERMYLCDECGKSMQDASIVVRTLRWGEVNTDHFCSLACLGQSVEFFDMEANVTVTFASSGVAAALFAVVSPATMGVPDV